MSLLLESFKLRKSLWRKVGPHIWKILSNMKIDDHRYLTIPEFLTITSPLSSKMNNPTNAINFFRKIDKENFQESLPRISIESLINYLQEESTLSTENYSKSRSKSRSRSITPQKKSHKNTPIKHSRKALKFSHKKTIKK